MHKSLLNRMTKQGLITFISSFILCLLLVIINIWWNMKRYKYEMTHHVLIQKETKLKSTVYEFCDVGCLRQIRWRWFFFSSHNRLLLFTAERFLWKRLLHVDIDMSYTYLFCKLSKLLFYFPFIIGDYCLIMFRGMTR